MSEKQNMTRLDYLLAFNLVHCSRLQSGSQAASGPATKPSRLVRGCSRRLLPDCGQVGHVFQRPWTRRFYSPSQGDHCPAAGLGVSKSRRTVRGLTARRRQMDGQQQAGNGDIRSRTENLRLAKPTLCQLSYVPKKNQDRRRGVCRRPGIRAVDRVSSLPRGIGDPSSVRNDLTKGRINRSCQIGKTKILVFRK